MSVDPAELRQAIALLTPEFPELQRSQLEAALVECECDISRARRKLLEAAPQPSSSQAATAATAPVRAWRPKPNLPNLPNLHASFSGSLAVLHTKHPLTSYSSGTLASMCRSYICRTMAPRLRSKT